MSDDLVKVVSTAKHCYAGRWYHTGDTLSVSKADAADLVALRFATIAPAEETPRAALLTKPLGLPKKPSLDQYDDKSRRYKRRDMEPEE